jgi:phosphate-selective porin OprO/OprP
MEYNGAVTFKPFENSDSILNSLGGGAGFSAGYQQYALQQNTISFLNGAGEPNTNAVFVDALGNPFFKYNNDVSANGLRSRVAPHIFWYGRFSVLAEYMNFSRVLTDGRNIGRSTQRAFYVNASYFLTGERDFKGSGFQAYSTVSPLRPFIPSRGEWGPGAWQIAAQYAMLNVGTGDFARGFANPLTSASRLESVMVGVNWWPNKYTRLSCDYVWNGLNRAIPMNGPMPIDTYSTIWMRFAMYF